MQTIKKQLSLIVLSSLPLLVLSQTQLVNNGGHLVSGPGFLVHYNSRLVNKGTIQYTEGTVKVTGTATAANSSIGGSSSSTFNHLTIDKTSNNAQLDQSVTVNG